MGTSRSALNINIHFQMLFLDGVYVVTPTTATGLDSSGCTNRRRPN
jgi:hypothetical protein